MRRRLRVWWHRDQIKNFGDELAPYLVEELTGRPVTFGRASRFPWPKTTMVVGSILAAANRNCRVWGAGIVSNQQIVHGGRFYAVRGPLSRRRVLECGRRCPEVYGDPALLLPLLSGYREVTKDTIGVVPHYVDQDLLSGVEWPDGVRVIDVRRPLREVIDSIRRCRSVVSSSLHGVIVAHAFGVPAGWVRFSESVFGDNVKYHDYFASLGHTVDTPAVLGQPLDCLEVEAVAVDSRQIGELQRGLLRAAPLPLLPQFRRLR